MTHLLLTLTVVGIFIIVAISLGQLVLMLVIGIIIGAGTAVWAGIKSVAKLFSSSDQSE